MKKQLSYSLLGLMIAVAPVSGALAWQKNAHSNSITRSEAMHIAERAVGGRAVGVDSERQHGRRIYEVNVRKARSLVKVDVDARSGRVLGTQREFRHNQDRRRG